uniref:site-specific DNA-methyltransferase (adenine-specific) n=1 Tax=Candidatus Kentrum sp. SD TaxID=2126332 RepID=A0A451BKA1_9GAMM|nr:MAG: Type I restriction-modification system, DNA methylase subunit [Candidatus Kentron sp. SD]VFK42868.1 MAG: Type I restriction-modification system, DNA methylase subunit [Candidatus Kentron sp. SD]VFK78668.1 MAG: Type I restriction-modification system, DNA methylase subunit [Candidatus Kentron sp. SD]
MDTQTLKDHGASLDKLRRFGTKDAGLLPYAALENARERSNSKLTALRGVYEWQENPLIFLIDGDQLNGEEHFRHIRRVVAMRGDAPYLGVVHPGKLTVHLLGLDSDSRKKSQIEIDVPKPHVFSRLINQRPDLASAKRAWVSEVVLKLLGEAILGLATTGLPKEDAISLAGRALFTRFLADRQLLIPPLPCEAIDPEHLFDDPQSVTATSAWLDQTFNGDLLPLSPKVLERLTPDACETLRHIMSHAPDGQLSIDWQEDWAHLDFAHIPVGVLSQAYEQYMRDHLPKKQQKEGSYYTPRAIVESMTSGAFHALRREGKAHEAKVLDPAVGGGVFLISAFRRLVAERWDHDKKRPDTRTLREILYNRITGFDINEEALRFAALGLYLISIELDPEPEPVRKLRFENLRGRVLFKFVGGDSARPLGSLGPEVGIEHVGRYDLVIGNPPWPTGTKLPHWDEVKEVVARIAKERLPEGTPPPPLPNEPLDLPFVWRAMEWARPGGQIAFALHARLLFQQGARTPEARRAVFRALDMTGVVNGAELRKTEVWPGITAPFCLLFSKNQTPGPGAGFRFVTPHIEKGLNNAGMLRIDVSNAEVITAQQIRERPEIFKILFRGTALDLEIFERIPSERITTLKSYWKSHGLKEGNGYKNKSEDEKNKRADECGLAGLPDLVLETKNLPLLIDCKNLLKIEKTRYFARPRKKEIYMAPLLIVHQSPPADFQRVRCAVADDDLVFNASYYGYSASGYSMENEENLLLLQYLSLLISSKPALWYVLMTSGKFGFERESFEKFIIDEMPIIPLDKLERSSKDKINLLFNSLVRNNSEENWAQVDAWAAELFGLNQRDLQVISDTLEYNLPFAANKKAAQAPVTAEKSGEFYKALEAELAPWAERAKTGITIKPVKELPAVSAWRLLRIETGRASPQASDDWPEILRIADDLGTTEVILPDDNGLWLARLNQARYWSQSQARLLARRIVWEHIDVLFGRSKAA